LDWRREPFLDDELDDGGETPVGMANSLEFLGVFLGMPFSDDGNGVTGLVGIDFKVGRK